MVVSIMVPLTRTASSSLSSVATIIMSRAPIWQSEVVTVMIIMRPIVKITTMALVI